MSSDVGTCNSAPRNNGVKTKQVSAIQVTSSRLTVTLNRIMRNSTQHGKPLRRRQAESLTHPREKVGQTVVSTLDALGNTGTSTGETQGGVTVRSEDDTGGSRGERLVSVEDVSRRGCAARDQSGRLDADRWDEQSEGKLGRDV